MTVFESVLFSVYFFKAFSPKQVFPAVGSTLITVQLRHDLLVALGTELNNVQCQAMTDRGK